MTTQNPQLKQRLGIRGVQPGQALLRRAASREVIADPKRPGEAGLGFRVPAETGETACERRVYLPVRIQEPIDLARE